MKTVYVINPRAFMELDAVIDSAAPDGSWAVVMAYTAYGYIWRYSHRALTLTEAETLVARVNESDKINPEYWEHVRTYYGSEAYVNNDVESQVRELEHMDQRGGYGYKEGEIIADNIWKCM